MVTGLFYDRQQAERAVEDLHELGYRQDDISVMMSDETRTRDFAESTGTKAAEGATTGGIIGGAIGAILAGVTTTGAILAVAGTGGLATPIVVGPLAAVLAGLGAGGLAGGIIGALVGAGIPEDRARDIETGLKRGGIMVAVHPHVGDETRVAQILDADTTSGVTDSTLGSTDSTLDSTMRGSSAMETGEIDRAGYNSIDDPTYTGTRNPL
jgi:hypothetical protein